MAEHHQNHFELHKLLHSKMSKLYIYQALLTFAKSLVSVFVPVFLYKSGFSLIDIMLYTTGVSFIFILIMPLTVKTIKKIGFKYTLLLSTPIYVLHLICLNFINTSNIYFHLAWLSFGFYVAFFWPTFHSEMALNGSSKNRTSQMGTFQIITTLVGTFAPAIGGLILTNSSYLSLLITSSVFILIGFIPFLFSKDIKLKKFNFGYKNYIDFFRTNKYSLSKKAFAFEGLNYILVIFIWPIIIFNLLNKNFLNYGALVTTISFISVMIIISIKKSIDKTDKTKYFKHTTKFLSFNWFLKSFVIFFGPFVLYFIEGISKLTNNIYNLLFTSIFYNNAKKNGYMNYIILREFYLHLTKILFAGLLILVFKFWGESLFVLNYIAVLGIFISFGLGYLKEDF